MADYHLAIRPGTDAWCLGGLAAILVQEGLARHDWMERHVANAGPVLEALSLIPVSRFAEVCGVDEALLRAAARRMAAAGTVASMEDLGMQRGVHSTLGSYLHRLIIALTGAFGRKGTSYAFVPFRPLGAGGGGGAASAGGKDSGERYFRRSPVTGFTVVMGLIPCNAISEEILTDHPHRFRAMIIESANPVHSLADSARPCLASQRPGARGHRAGGDAASPRGRGQRTHRLPLARSGGRDALAQTCAGPDRTGRLSGREPRQRRDQLAVTPAACLFTSLNAFSYHSVPG